MGTQNDRAHFRLRRVLKAFGDRHRGQVQGHDHHVPLLLRVPPGSPYRFLCSLVRHG